MTGDGATVDQLRRYLRELKPSARSLLIGELECSVLRGDEIAGASLILRELRVIIREQRDGAPCIGDCARHFFKPLEPFMVDDVADHKHPGRIARCSLEPLWIWVRRDLLPEEAKVLAAAVKEALFVGDEPKAERLARAFQDRAAAGIATAFAEAERDEKTYRRLLAQIGTPRAADDAAVLRRALKGRDILETFGAHLPAHIVNLTDARLDEVKARIDFVTARKPDIFAQAVLLAMSRLAAPWQLVRLATRAAGSDVAARVAETPYAVAVVIVLAELERLVGELRSDLRSGRGVAVGALLKTIHDCARGLRTELDLPIDSTWGRALAGLRGQISDLLKSEIESTPGRVRRLLRPCPSSEIRPHSALDADEVAQTEASIEFVGTCRYFASELAINEMTQRNYSALQRYLDGGTRALLDGLRHAGAADRSFRQSQVDAAGRFCSKVFGADYGAMLAKAAETAGIEDRKAASG